MKREGWGPLPDPNAIDPGPLTDFVASVVARRAGLDPADPSVIDLAETERVLAAVRIRLEQNVMDSFALDIFSKYQQNRLRLLSVLGLDKPGKTEPEKPLPSIRG